MSEMQKKFHEVRENLIEVSKRPLINGGILGLYVATIGAAALALTVAVDVKSPTDQPKDQQTDERTVEDHKPETPAL